MHAGVASAAFDPTTEHRARYLGTGGGLFVLVFKNLLLTIVTLGIYLPWARTERRRYVWQNVEFDGHRFRYHGTGLEMFKGYVKVVAAYAVFFGVTYLAAAIDPTLGAIVQFALIVPILILIPIAIYLSQRYLLSRTSLRGIHFGLDPGAREYLGLFVGGYLLTLVTLGLYGPVWQNRLYAFVMKRTRYGNVAFDYDGENADAWRITIKGLVLTVLTLGIYLPWYTAELARFRTEHTSFMGARGRLALTGGDMFLIMVLSVLAVLTFGLAFPFVTTYALQTIAAKTALQGYIDWELITRRSAAGEAGADALADALDVGLEI